jgi:hypothetical protein
MGARFYTAEWIILPATSWWRKIFVEERCDIVDHLGMSRKHVNPFLPSCSTVSASRLRGVPVRCKRFHRFGRTWYAAVMLGWFSAATARASSMKRLSRSRSFEKAAWRILIATSRFSGRFDCPIRDVGCNSVFEYSSAGLKIGPSKGCEVWTHRSPS